MEGRIGVRSSQDSWQANLFWSHDDRQDRLRLSGPLSQGLISIIVQPDLIYINEGNGVEQLARDPEAALKARLGFSVPLRSLRYWMLGVPNPAESWRPSASGEDGAFEQQGWRVIPTGHAEIGGYHLPERLSVEGAGVRLKILVDQWRPG
jgi:outer membrane lipoprotein LolB